MRISTVAALMILTTVMLSVSACSQSQMATLDDRSGNYYGMGDMQPPKYSDWNRATQDDTVAYKYKSDTHNYAPDAEVPSVSSTDLPPPSTAANGAAPRIQDRTFRSPVPAAQPQSAITTSPFRPALTPEVKAPRAAEKPFARAASPLFAWPAQGTLRNKFGAQGEGVVNEGITIAARDGTPIYAAADGEVAFVGNQVSNFGNVVIMRHAGGYMTSYAHAKEFLVSTGDRVKKGDLLGYVGNTGSVREAQLHFTVRRDSANIDPLSVLPQQVAGR